MIFYAVCVEELAIPNTHPFATLDKVIINATREAVEDTIDCDGIPSWMVHKVRSAITQNNYGGRQACFKIRDAFNIKIEFVMILSRNLLQNIRCRSVDTLEDCLIKWDNRMQMPSTLNTHASMRSQRRKRHTRARGHSSRPT